MFILNQEGGHSSKKQGNLVGCVKSRGGSLRGVIWRGSRWCKPGRRSEKRGGAGKKGMEEKAPETPVKERREKAVETPEKEKEKDKSLAALVKSVVVGGSFGIMKGDDNQPSGRNQRHND